MIIKTLFNYIKVMAFFTMTLCFSQEKEINLIESYINQSKIKKADSLIKLSSRYKFTQYETNYIEYLKALIKFHYGSYDLAFNKASKLRNRLNQNLLLIVKTEGLMIDCISYLNNSLIDKSNLINSFCINTKKLNDYSYSCDCAYYKGTIAFENDSIDKGIKQYQLISKIAKENNDSIKYYNNQLNIAMLVGYYQDDPQKSISIYSDIIPFFKESKDFERQFLASYNLSEQYEKLGHLKIATEKLISADTIKIASDILANKQLLYQKLSLLYEMQLNFKQSIHYYKLSNNLKDSIDNTKQTIAISSIKEQFDNEKLRADNLEIEAKRKQNRNLLFGSLALLLFGGITFVLIQKNTKRKQLLAIKEKELESQKVTNLLKEQELTAIDAMIEGQEKERQRIANDLHDDLGGLMATVKLHFNALKEKQSPELYEKTNQLLDKAYHKVRSVAHAKNSGVMAKKGLLKALNDMANTVSASNKLQVDVIDHGLDERLENSLELTIFRIVQELITNVIKHAEAMEATIHITKHDDSLNIMVEDNGKGFDTKNIQKNSGMGIHSIDKRIENLGGKVTLESEINKGTIIIIDIPT